MNLTDLLPVIAIIAAVVLGAAVLDRVIPGRGLSLRDAITPTTALDWPLGVQEEEPARWQVERLGRRRPRPSATQPADRSDSMLSAHQTSNRHADQPRTTVNSR